MYSGSLISFHKNHKRLLRRSKRNNLNTNKTEESVKLPIRGNGETHQCGPNSKRKIGSSSLIYSKCVAKLRTAISIKNKKIQYLESELKLVTDEVKFLLNSPKEIISDLKTSVIDTLENEVNQTISTDIYYGAYNCLQIYINTFCHHESLLHKSFLDFIEGKIEDPYKMNDQSPEVVKRWENVKNDYNQGNISNTLLESFFMTIIGERQKRDLVFKRGFVNKIRNCFAEANGILEHPSTRSHKRKYLAPKAKAVKVIREKIKLVVNKIEDKNAISTSPQKQEAENENGMEIQPSSKKLMIVLNKLSPSFESKNQVSSELYPQIQPKQVHAILPTMEQEMAEKFVGNFM